MQISASNKDGAIITCTNLLYFSAKYSSSLSMEKNQINKEIITQHNTWIKLLYSGRMMR